MGERRHQGREAASPAMAPGEAALEAFADRNADTGKRRSGKRIHRTSSEGAVRDATLGGNAHQGTAVGNGRPMVHREDPEDNREGKRVAVLTPEGVLRIGMRACKNSQHNVASRRAAWQYGLEKRKLERPLGII
jgi:hypothetical protein